MLLPLLCRSDVVIMSMRTGGSGRKYSAYALAKRLAIAAMLTTVVDGVKSRGM